MSNLLWLSDSPLTPTGYATISTNICNRLSNEWNIHYMGHNYIGLNQSPGDVKVLDGNRNKFTLYGMGREGYCKDLILPRIQILQPKVFGILLDTFMLYPWLLDMNFSPAKSIFYFPSDGGGGLPLNCENIIRHMTVGVAMSKFAQRQAKEYYNIDTEYIPHAIDEKVYYPLPEEDRINLKKNFEVMTISGGIVKNVLANKFVVGTVSRNQGRKMLDRMFKAFEIFCRDKPDAILMLHSDPFDAAAVFDMPSLIRRYKLENRVVFSPMKFFEGRDYKKMNEVYNVMDVFLLPTSGEGFGIPIIEAMACKVPPVVTDYTTTPELLVENGLCGLPVKLAGVIELNMSEALYERGFNLQQIDMILNNGTITGSWNVERALMDINDCVVQLNKLYYDRNLLKQLGNVGREKVLKYYTWDKVIEDWRRLLNRMTE